MKRFEVDLRRAGGLTSPGPDQDIREIEAKSLAEAKRRAEQIKNEERWEYVRVFPVPER